MNDTLTNIQSGLADTTTGFKNLLIVYAIFSFLVVFALILISINLSKIK